VVGISDAGIGSSFPFTALQVRSRGHVAVHNVRNVYLEITRFGHCCTATWHSSRPAVHASLRLPVGPKPIGSDWTGIG